MRQSWSGQLVARNHRLQQQFFQKHSHQVGGWKHFWLLHQLQSPDRYQQQDSRSRNQVLITSRGGTDGYSESTLLAKLSMGGSYIIENFVGSGLPVIIWVTAINTVVSPGHADITISSATLAPTPAPTLFFCTADAQCTSLGDNNFLLVLPGCHVILTQTLA